MLLFLINKNDVSKKGVGGFKRSNSAASGDSKPVFSRSLANKIANAKNAQMRASVNNNNSNTKSLNSSMNSSSVVDHHRNNKQQQGGAKIFSQASDAASTSTSVSVRTKGNANNHVGGASQKNSLLSTHHKNK